MQTPPSPSQLSQPHSWHFGASIDVTGSVGKFGWHDELLLLLFEPLDDEELLELLLLSAELEELETTLDDELERSLDDELDDDSRLEELELTSDEELELTTSDELELSLEEDELSEGLDDELLDSLTRELDDDELLLDELLGPGGSPHWSTGIS